MDAIVESLENAIQITVLLLCMILAFVRMHSVREKSWLLLMSFYGSFLLGDLYWQVCLFCLGTIPEVSIVSDLSWYASYLFLFLLLCIPGKQKGSVAGIPADSKMRLIPYLAPVFTGAMAVFYMGSGKIITNIVYAALMGLLLFTASRGKRGTSGLCTGRSLFSAFWSTPCGRPPASGNIRRAGISISASIFVSPCVFPGFSGS